MSKVQKPFQHGSLFSGIGGFDLAAEMMGWENVFHCEKDERARMVLKKNFPKVKSYSDIFELDATKYEGIDIITGGFPCQPFSGAGNRKGENDDRYLWPEMLRVIRESKPTFVIGENVFGLVTLEGGKTIETIYTDLENEGYEVESFIIPAAAVQAQHRRDRIWILAYASSEQRYASFSKDVSTKNRRKRQKEWGENRVELKLVEGIGHSKSGFYNGHNIEPCVIRDSNGVSDRLDRLKQCGNAIDPRVAYELFQILAEASKRGYVSE